MKYIPSPSTFIKTAQQLAEYLRSELQRISSSISSIESEGWNDLRFPATGINLSGSAAPPAVDNSTSAMAVTGTLLFSGSLQNDVVCFSQMPHGWVPGLIEPHIHTRREAASTDGVAWKIYYNILGNPTDQPVGWVGPVDGTVAVGDYTSAYEHCIVSFPQVDMTSYYDSACIAWRITREGNSDSYAGVVRLLEFDIHIRQRAFGSADIYARKQA